MSASEHSCSKLLWHDSHATCNNATLAFAPCASMNPTAFRPHGPETTRSQKWLSATTTRPSLNFAPSGSHPAAGKPNENGQLGETERETEPWKTESEPWFWFTNSHVCL